MMSTISHIPPARSVDVLLGIVAFVLIVFANRYVETSYDRYRVMRVDGPQSHYHEEPVIEGEVLYWAEFGVEGRLVERVALREDTLRTDRFYPSEHWAREIYWSYRAKENGSVAVDLTHFDRTGLRVGIFATDGDSYYRVAIARSEDQVVILDDLHNGRWFWFDVVENERRDRYKTIDIRRLMGTDVAISGLVVVGIEE